MGRPGPRCQSSVGAQDEARRSLPVVRATPSLLESGDEHAHFAHSVLAN